MKTRSAIAAAAAPASRPRISVAASAVSSGEPASAEIGPKCKASTMSAINVASSFRRIQ